MPAILLLGYTLQAFPQTDPAAYYNRLFYLSKAWGHAKYYHTEIAKGTVAWDDQLLTAIAATKNAGSDAEFSAIVLAMLNSAGPMATSTATLPEVPDDLNNNLDHSWIDQPIFSAEVRLELQAILEKFRPQPNYYVGQAFSAGNPTFDTDNQYYTSENYPSEGIRLLALFRYWNIYNYFFPYKNLIDQNWDGVLSEFIPKMVEATDEVDFHLSLKELTTRVNDSHAGLSSPVYSTWHGTFYPPFLIRYIDNETVITKVLADKTSLVPGDIIKEIDGNDIYQLRINLRKYASGSNDPAIERSLNNIIVSGNEGLAEIKVLRGTTFITETINRDNLNSSSLQVNDSPIWKTTEVSGCPFGIVDMARLETTQVSTMFSDLRNTKAIIFDIRNYPLGTLWTLVNYLFPGPIHIADFTVPDVTYPGRLFWKSTTIGTGTSTPYSGKVILLFDERTISQAEYTCMGLEQFPDAIKIGSTTAGADGNVSKIYLTGNSYATMTGLGTFYPDRTPTQRVGIIPDYEVHPTIAGILAGRDEVLEFALNPALLTVHPGYCTSAGNATSEWIASVGLGSITKSSGSSTTIGYEDFTTTEFRVEAGKSYTISLKPGYLKAAFENWAVYIDYNGDQGFDETGELVFSKRKSKTLVSGTISIPAGLSLTTRMRVIMSSGAITGPCSMMVTGEVEDYTLIIAAPEPDPLVANFSANPVSVDVGSPVQFTDLSTGIPTGWSWSFTGGVPSTSALQNPSVTYSLPGTYSVTLTVTRADATNTVTKTNFIAVREIAPAQYCIPISLISSSDYIKTVLVQNVFSNTTGGGGYSYYPDAGTLITGSNYNLTLTPNNSTYRNYWKIWIDFNGDYDFNDTGECVLTANNKKGAFTAVISIPTGAAGPTRMRVSMRNAAAPMPCDDGFIGEVEDYGISLISSGSPGNRIATRLPGESAYSSLNLYPNPVSQELHIRLGSLAGNDILEIYSAEGKKMLRQPLVSTEITVDVSRFTNGLYFIRIISDNESVTKRIIKE